MPAAAAACCLLAALRQPLAARTSTRWSGAIIPIPIYSSPSRKPTGIKVNVKEFEGTGAGLAIVDQSQPGDWDVMVIDSIDVPRGVEKGPVRTAARGQAAPRRSLPEVTMDGSTKIDGKRYGITEKFGYNTIGFNNSKVDPADMQTMASLLDRQIQGPHRDL